ncbi:hypothetical protein [Leptospira yasudae]|nr:hypothetical protein [Leptospira yasudae]
MANNVTLTGLDDGTGDSCGNEKKYYCEEQRVTRYILLIVKHGSR